LASQSPWPTFGPGLLIPEAAGGVVLTDACLRSFVETLERNRLVNQLECLPSEFPFLLQAIDLVRPNPEEREPQCVGLRPIYGGEPPDPALLSRLPLSGFILPGVTGVWVVASSSPDYPLFELWATRAVGGANIHISAARSGF
jgi:hypothetical protein